MVDASSWPARLPRPPDSPAPAQCSGLLRKPPGEGPRVLTDNGSAFRSKQFAAACAAVGARHKFTRPYQPHQWQGRTLHSISIPASAALPWITGSITTARTARIRGSSASRPCRYSKSQQTTSVNACGSGGDQLEPMEPLVELLNGARTSDDSSRASLAAKAAKLWYAGIRRKLSTGQVVAGRAGAKGALCLESHIVAVWDVRSC